MKSDLIRILQPLEGHLSSVESQIEIQLKSGVPDIDEAAAYLFRQGGKRIRASMVLLSGGLSGEIPDEAVQIAAAVEIIHAATLIHDDIIDQSVLRRGNLSAPQKWGNKVSVLLGDFLYTVALSMAIKTGDERIYPVMVEGTKDMVQGELYQLQYSNIDAINREHYYRIIELKTARFMAACTKMGAIKGGMNAPDCDKLYDFGLNTGFAFQIIDDTLDLLVDAGTLGKDIRSDVTSGKITLPFIYFIEQRSGGRELIKKFQKEPNDANWEELTRQLRETSSIDGAMKEARKYVDTSTAILNGFKKSRFSDILMELSEFFVSRNF